jgi:hypothetical protein
MITKNQISHMPPAVFGEVDKINDFGFHPWIKNLKGKSVFVSLGTNWPFNSSVLPADLLPQGYKYYIVSGDSVMLTWIDQLAEYLQAPVIYLSLPKTYDYQPLRPNAYFFPFTFFHQMCSKLQEINTTPVTKNIKYKISALTNRITQSKAIIFSAVKKYLHEQDCLLSLNSKNITLKNVHNWEPSGNLVCDEMMEEFCNKWQHQNLTVDDFFLDSSLDKQNNFNHPAYTQAALNFTQESYHYSLQHEDGRQYICPGPFLTEKTLKCLLSGTAFISSSQFDAYGYLTEAGMKFDYGALDLSYDRDPGNLTRLAGVINLVKDLDQWSAQDIYDMTFNSTKHNLEVIASGDFYKYCDSQNQKSIENIFNFIG